MQKSWNKQLLTWLQWVVYEKLRFLIDLSDPHIMSENNQA